MQDIIIDEIAKHSLLGVKAKILIRALFQSNYDLPFDVAERRPSFLNFKQVIGWGGSVENAHIASLSALNSQHGCFGEAYDLIKVYFESKMNGSDDYYVDKICFILNSGGKIAGWGSPIYKGSDRRCEAILMELENTLPEMQDIIDSLITVTSTTIDKEGVYPNLVFWNALVIYLLGLPKTHASLVFILATQIRYVNSLMSTNLEE